MNAPMPTPLPPGYNAKRVADRVLAADGIHDRVAYSWHIHGPGGSLDLFDDDPDRDKTFAAFLMDVLPTNNPMRPDAAAIATAGKASQGQPILKVRWS